MFWLWIGLALIVGLAGGFFGTLSVVSKTATEAVDQIKNRLANDQDTLMRTFRRELANWLFRSDPDRFQALYDRARRLEREIFGADPIQQKAMLRRIAEEIPTIDQFDLFQMREYIPYGEVMSSLDEIEKRYLDIVSWQSLQIAMDPAWKWVKKPTSDDDEKYLPKIAERMKNSRFRKRLEYTMRLYWFARHATDEVAFDNVNFSVRAIPGMPESRYGIHLKDTDEFGIFSVFYDADRSFESYYRSDADFTTEHSVRVEIEEEPPMVAATR